MDIKDGRTVKGINFVGLRDAGNPVELAKKYSEQGADELVFLDISATDEKRKTLIHLVEELSKEINIPFTVGGGISTLKDVDLLLKAGADKVSLNSSAVKNPKIIAEISQRFGNQCVVVAVDSKQIENQDYSLAFWKKALEPLATASLVLIAISFIFGPLRSVTMGLSLVSSNQVSGRLSDRAINCIRRRDRPSMAWM